MPIRCLRQPTANNQQLGLQTCNKDSAHVKGGASAAPPATFTEPSASQQHSSMTPTLRLLQAHNTTSDHQQPSVGCNNTVPPTTPPTRNSWLAPHLVSAATSQSRTNYPSCTPLSCSSACSCAPMAATAALKSATSCWCLSCCCWCCRSRLTTVARSPATS